MSKSQILKIKLKEKFLKLNSNIQFSVSNSENFFSFARLGLMPKGRTEDKISLALLRITSLPDMNTQI
jgi:hypothetical protein